jgi:transposase
MKKTGMAKLEAIGPKTMVGGIDIAKRVHWARFVDWRGIPIGKAIRFENNKAGFEHIVAESERLRKQAGMDDVVLGMEPTGPYWKALAWRLKSLGLRVVTVNTHHTKQAKELDDNSPTKNDKKDALVIARLVKDGRYYEPYLPVDVYGELRVCSNTRIALVKKMNACKNRITGILDEYFPEFSSVFKKPLKGKASLHLLRTCPFPCHLLALGADGVLAKVKMAVKKSVGKKRVTALMRAAADSVGVTYGLESARMQLRMLVEELEFLAKQLEEVERRMEELLDCTGYKEQLLGIKGVGNVTAASFLGEIGDPLRFDNPRQIHRMAGYNLVENSSGQNKSGTSISKRGRKQLRALLFKMAMVMVAQNSELKQLYQYLRSRPNNPLKGKQALIVISKKIVTIIYQVLKTHSEYQPALVLGPVRKQQLGLAA